MTEWRDGMPAEWVTETEPEFDPNELDDWYALWEYEQELCPQCGNLRVLCEDPAQLWNPQMTTCYATVAQTMHTRRWHRLHEKTKPDADGWHPEDGALIWASTELPPDPVFGLLGSSEQDESD